jgi:thiol-disulfide isomerase/thioredoxin
MMFLNEPIAYLVDSDIDSSGNLVNEDIPKDIPVMIMIQAGFCGHCTNAKPAYQEFANNNVGKVFCATIQADGKEAGEKELGKRLSTFLPEFRGFPDYRVYHKGKMVKNHKGGRNVKDLENCISSLSL